MHMCICMRKGRQADSEKIRNASAAVSLIRHAVTYPAGPEDLKQIRFSDQCSDHSAEQDPTKAEGSGRVIPGHGFTVTPRIRPATASRSRSVRQILFVLHSHSGNKAEAGSRADQRSRSGSDHRTAERISRGSACETDLFPGPETATGRPGRADQRHHHSTGRRADLRRLTETAVFLCMAKQNRQCRPAETIRRRESYENRKKNSAERPGFSLRQA